MRFEEFIYYERRDAAKDVTRDCIFDLLEDYGEIPPSLKEKLETINDIDLLKKYHKLAARAGSMEAFIAGIQ